MWQLAVILPLQIAGPRTRLSDKQISFGEALRQGVLAVAQDIGIGLKVTVGLPVRRIWPGLAASSGEWLDGYGQHVRQSSNLRSGR
jgi:hypothetical protein